MSKLVSWVSSLAVGVLMAALCGGCSAKVKAASHLRRADHYFQASQYDRAEIEYKNVLRNAPQDSRAWSQLGIIFFEEGRLGEAVPVLNHAQQLDGNNLEVRLRLATIFLVTGHQKEAQEEIAFLLEKDPANAKAPILLAEAAATNQLVEVEQRLQAFAKRGETAPVAVALGTIAFREQHFAAAEADFKRALNLDPKFDDAYSALGKLYLLQKNLKEAEQAFKTAAELAQPRSGKSLEYAQFQFAAGNTNDGQTILQRLVGQAPDYLPAWLELAQFAAAQHNYSEATTFLANVLTRDPRNFDGLLLQGRLDLLQGQASDAISGFQKMAEMYPAVATVRYQLALAYLATNRMDTAVVCLNQAVGLNPQYADAIMLLAQIQVQRGHSDAAEASLMQLIQQQPQLVAARLLLANAYRAKGDWDGALKVLQGLEAANPDNYQLHLLLGMSFLQQKKTTEARNEFSLAYKLAPDSLLPLEQLVNLDLAEKQYPDASQLVQTASEKSSHPVEMRLLTAKILLAEGNHDQAEASLLKTIDLAPENQTAYLMLAQMYHDTGKNKEALARLDTAVARDPNDITALMLSGVIYNEEKDYENAASTYEKLLKVNPRFSPALNNLAYLYSESLSNHLDRAYELAQNARDLMPYDPSMADTLGWICFKRGSFTVAMSLLQESAAKLPDEPEVQFHLGMACYMTGDEAAASTAFRMALQSNRTFPGQDECRKCLSILGINAASAGTSDREILENRIAESPYDPAALIRLAVIYQRTGNSKKAVSACETVLRANPNNLAALLGLARIYAENDVTHAIELVQDAYKLAPDNPEVCRLYGNLAGRTRDYKLAANMLQLSVQNQPDNAGVLYEFAEAALRVGKVAEAQTALQNALRLDLEKDRVGPARQMLDLVRLATSAQPPGSSNRVAEILKSQPDYLPALFAASSINESQGDLTGSIQIWEKILNLYPDFAPAARQLAWLYASDPSHLDRAYSMALKARETYPDDPFVAKTLGIILLQKGDASRALKLLEESAVSGADAETYFYLGASQYKLHQRADSKASLQKALELKLTDKQAQAAKQMLQTLNSNSNL